MDFLKNFKFDQRTAIIIVAIMAAIVLIPALTNGGGGVPTGDVDPDVNSPRSSTGGGTLPESAQRDVRLGEVVSATEVDRDGCAAQRSSVFDDDDAIYIVASGSRIPEDTAIFVRLYYENDPINDSNEIVADRDYENTCINFVFDNTGAGFDIGGYEAEFVINGNLSGETVNFEVRR